jgi:acyl carrier protein
MKTREEIIAQVNSLLAEEFEIEESEFAPDANLKETLNLDSINLVDLIALVQFTYKITIPVEDLKKIQTFTDLYDYIEQHQGCD